jgi:hypothetical protein
LKLIPLLRLIVAGAATTVFKRPNVGLAGVRVETVTILKSIDFTGWLCAFAKHAKFIRTTWLSTASPAIFLITTEISLAPIIPLTIAIRE